MAAVADLHMLCPPTDPRDALLVSVAPSRLALAHEVQPDLDEMFGPSSDENREGERLRRRNRGPLLDITNTAPTRMPRLITRY
jgi:hypothetical protein